MQVTVNHLSLPKSSIHSVLTARKMFVMLEHMPVVGLMDETDLCEKVNGDKQTARVCCIHQENTQNVSKILKKTMVQ